MYTKNKGFISKLKVNLLGDEESFQFDHRFINSLSLGISATSLIGFFINLFLGLGIIETRVTFLNAIIYFFIYCLCRFFKKVVLAKWIAILIAYIVLSVLWLNSAGSSGPIPYTYFILVLSVVLLTDKWSRGILLLLLALNISLLFYFENRFPEFLIEYESAADRRIDIITSMLLYFALGTIIMSYAKGSYIKEKLKAQKADKLKTAFLANMSHEIRTPMNAIMGFTGLLRNNSLPEEKREKYYKTVDDSVEYLLRLIDDILDISRIEADELTILPRKINLDEFLNFIEISHQQLIPPEKRDKLRVFFENAGNDITIESDIARLEQIISNLISNAIKFTPQGYVKFGYREHKRQVLFYIHDTGIGIDEKDMESIFDRFVKLDSSNFEILHRGTGIGLAIAKKIVELLGGKIWLESAPKKGSIFYFTMPLKPSNKIKRETL